MDYVVRFPLLLRVGPSLMEGPLQFLFTENLQAVLLSEDPAIGSIEVKQDRDTQILVTRA